MFAQALQLGIVLDGVDGQGQEKLGGFDILDIEGSLLADQCEGILGLVVFGHIRTGHQDDRLAQQAELADGTGPGTADYNVGRLIGSTHVADEVGDHHIVGLADLVELFHDLGMVILARLPDKLYPTLADMIEMAQDTLVDGAGTEAAANNEYGLVERIQTEGAQGIVLGNLGVILSISRSAKVKKEKELTPNMA